MHIVGVTGEEKSYSNMVFDVLRRGANERHMLKVVDKVRAIIRKRRTATSNGKSMNGS